MGTIDDYQEDTSAMERLKAWEFAINMAGDRFTGGGFNCWSLENYAKYAPGAKQAFVAHSIYFGVLAENGWPGLIMFLLILFMIWRQLGRIIQVTEGDEDRADYNFLARMLQVSMLAFMSGGAFLSLAYFDLAWHIMAITIAMTQLTLKGAAKKVDKPSDDPPARRPRGVAQGRGRRVPARP